VRGSPRALLGSPERRVGLFVVVAFALLMWGTLRIRGAPDWFQPEGFELIARFGDVSGLALESDVVIAGVEVGRVSDISLERGAARVVLRIDSPGLEIPNDSEVSVRSRGLLGERVLEIVLGSSERALPSGGVLTRTQSATDVDQFIDRLSNVAADAQEISASFRNALGGPSGEETVREIVGNLRDLTRDMSSVVADNASRVERVVTNLDAFSSDLAALTDENRAAVHATVANLQRSSSRLADALERVAVVSERMEQGEGTIGRFITDDAVYVEVDGALAEARAALREVRRAAEETQEQIPSTILLSIFGSLF
jgi:phospholipid/cholesterol/gamma-HCH transport system substrate-binding protein